MEWPKSKFYFVFSQITSLPSNVPDSQVLVEKIVRLQKELAKRQEKLDFMEEHVGTMVEEMKKKNKLLQILMLKQDAGALASEGMDTDKVMIVKLRFFWKTLYLDTTFLMIYHFLKKPAMIRNVLDENSEVFIFSRIIYVFAIHPISVWNSLLFKAYDN